jgi:hypothetical protein
VAIKGNQLLHFADGTILIERLQTGGPGTLDIPKNRIYELGNYESLAVLRDRPDLTFSLESFDVSLRLERLLCGKSAGVKVVNMGENVPQNYISAFKAGQSAVDPFLIVGSVSIPWITLESISYRFGVRDNARQSATLRGSEIYYSPAGTFTQAFTGTGAPGQTLICTHPAYPYQGETTVRYALCVATQTKKLQYGIDYSETAGAPGGGGTSSLSIVLTNGVTGQVKVTVASNDVMDPVLQAEHTPVSVLPAAVRGRDLAVYVGGFNPADLAGSAQFRWDGVQTASMEWRQTLEADEELGNFNLIDYGPNDVPSLNGTVEVRSVDPSNLWRKIRQATGATTTEAIGPNTAIALPFTLAIFHPETHALLKWFTIDDARITVPGFQGQVQQKMNVTFTFDSDSGKLTVSEP